ncbi:hypothetical protein KCU81_g9781, partial [Aureobasidium melanogenum]
MSSSINVGIDNTGLWGIKQTPQASSLLSNLMQQDLEKHHVFLNDIGFHDHMPHHLLALYGTGASAEDIQKAWDQRDPLQRPALPRNDRVVKYLIESWNNSMPYLGKEEHYADFLAYFQHVIQIRGYQAVVNEHLFRANDPAQLLVRLHAGVLHPLIQLMYGLEWEQPAVVAEGLAQAAIHGIEQLDELLVQSERMVYNSSSTGRIPNLLTIYKRIQQDPQLSHCVRPDDEEKIIEGVIGRSKEEMLAVLQEVRVHAEDLAERTAEMFHNIVLVASGAALHPHKHVKYDFFLMHHINSSLMYLTINKQHWITEANKVRMLEWKIRMDLLQYAARGAPDFSAEAIRSYEPKIGLKGGPRQIATKLHSFGDDGHAIKQARATSLCHELIAHYKGKSWAVLVDDDLWIKIQHMVIDAVEGPGPLYDIPLASAQKRSPAELLARQ